MLSLYAEEAAPALSALYFLNGDGQRPPKAPDSHRMSTSTGTKAPPTMPPMQPPPHEELGGGGGGGGNGTCMQSLELVVPAGLVLRASPPALKGQSVQHPRVMAPAWSLYVFSGPNSPKGSNCYRRPYTLLRSCT